MITVLIIIAVLISVSIVMDKINADAIILAMYINSGKDIKIPPKPIFKPKEPTESEEEKRARILSENIENYDGSGRNQQRI